MTLDELRRVVPAGCLIEGPSTVTMIMVTVTPTSLMRDVERSQAVMLLAGIGVAVPTKYNPKCGHCDKEETAAEEKFQHCKCNPKGAPYYCNKQCQKGDWHKHRASCSERKQRE